MDLILTTGFTDEEIAAWPLRLREGIRIEVYNSDTGLLPEAEAVLIGPHHPDPVKLVQDIYTIDKFISILLCCMPAKLQTLKQSVQFTPFVSKHTLCVAYTEHLDLHQLVQQAGTRTRQRRSFQKINEVLAPSVAPSPAPILPIEHLGSFLEEAPIGAILAEPGTERIVAINKKAKELLEIDTPKQGMVLQEILDVAAYTKIREYLSGPGTKTIQIRARHLQVTASTVKNEDGNSFPIFYFEDITIQKQEEHKIRSILEAMPQMAWTTDRVGNATYFNKSWYFHTGQSSDTALGTGWSHAVFPDDLENLLARWHESLEHKKMYQVVARFINSEGAPRWFLVKGSPVLDTAGEVTMWVGSCTDIHDQIMLTEELEKKVKERTKLLEESNTELQQYAHISSHDLQEPLRKISTFTSIIQTKAHDKLDETTKKYIDKIAATAGRMTQTLRDLLSFTKLNKTDHFVAVDLNQIVDHVLEDMELVIARKSATINKQMLPTIQAVPIQMNQLFYNLINNALKFSQKDIPPVINISARQLSEEEVLLLPDGDKTAAYIEIMVQDNGIGFEQQYADQIFSLFARLHGKTEYEGTGIGLAICKKVIANHKGFIHVSSEPGQGSTFKIILPQNPSE